MSAVDYRSMPRESGGSDYFESKIRLKCYKDKFISVEEEAELVDFATRLLNPPMMERAAREVILRWAELNHVAVESRIQARCTDMLKIRTLDDSRIDQQEFEGVVAYYRQACFGKLADDEIRIRLKALMLENGWKAKKDGFFGSQWFKSIPI